MVETLLEQEPEPDIRSLSLRHTTQPHAPYTSEPEEHYDTETLHTTDNDAIKPRLNPTPSQIKEKDFVHNGSDAVDKENTERARIPALARLRRPYQEREDSDRPQRSQSTPAHSRAPHITFSLNQKPKDDSPSAFAQATPLPPQRLNDVGPPRPPKNIAELFAPDRKLGGDPGWTQSFVNTVKCESLVFPFLVPLSDDWCWIGSYFNLMIFLVPVAWALHLTHQNDVIVFVFCFLSVIPLANLLSFATEQLALRVGEAIGGLLNARQVTHYPGSSLGY
jgi:hypothetical protein